MMLRLVMMMMQVEGLKDARRHNQIPGTATSRGISHCRLIPPPCCLTSSFFVGMRKEKRNHSASLPLIHTIFRSYGYNAHE